MAAAPCDNRQLQKKQDSGLSENGNANNKVDRGGDDGESSESEDDVTSVELHEEQVTENMRLAIACDDGCVRIYSISNSDELTYRRALSVTWSPDASRIYSGSSDGFIRCWDAGSARELYRITVGLGGLGSGPELCIWSLLALRCGTLVSADSTGSVQFWDAKHGTLLQAHSCHKGDVNALAAVPSHSRVYSAGSDGRVILYKLSNDEVGSSDDKSLSTVMKKWVYVGYVRAHTHDVRALTVAVPISREDLVPDEKGKRFRGMEKPLDFSYLKWAHLGVPMLISAVRVKRGAVTDMGSGASGGHATTDLVARVKSKASRKIICSTISSSGVFLAYSDHVKVSLLELKNSEAGKSAWLVVDVGSLEVIHAFTPSRKDLDEKLPPSEPPITKMFTSSDGQWLAAINCFGDQSSLPTSSLPIRTATYAYRLHFFLRDRQHWFISRLDGASVTAGGFTPRNSNVLIISTSSNQVYAFDVEAKQLGEWSMRNTFVLPRRYQEFPGEVIGLSFPPSLNSSSVIVYSDRAMCLIDFGRPVDRDDDHDLVNGHDSVLKKFQKSPINGRLKQGKSRFPKPEIMEQPSQVYASALHGLVAGVGYPF
ncbi:hypothetical protein RJ639_038216 [Escallonia herrerae]|uniref:U3 small nucleolar RNA-associated protein 4 n=1 Tax=Escallonia herrerae TaxID=1293975 RepID=A0AA89B544_9ASTE|nr:hypothetical protein RJ639_038216 [Escallonia herrerae]